MEKTDKILTALLPTTFDLFFKFLKSKLLAEAPWELDMERDQALVEPSKQASIPRHGVIRLYHAPQRIIKWFGTSPFVSAYFDGKKHHPLPLADIHWQLLGFQPFKAEYDAWKAESEANAARIQAQEPQQQLAAPLQAESKPAQAPTITFTVKPKN
jgi:hypothetical protein